MEAVTDPESSGPVEVPTDERESDARTEQTDLGFEQGEGDDVLVAEAVSNPASEGSDSVGLKAVIEAVIYVTDEPLTPEQIAAAIEQPLPVVNDILQQLVAEYAAPGRGLAIRELAGGYKMSTKPEYHESIRRFVKGLQPPLKLSLAALETLAVVAYKQPITGPEILDIRGVQGAGVLKTLLDRRLIATAGRKNVLGKPMMYKTTREFLIQFGLDSVTELPTLKEFEELGRLALTDEEVTLPPEPAAASASEPAGTSSGEATSDQHPESADEHAGNPGDQDGASVDQIQPAAEEISLATPLEVSQEEEPALAEAAGGTRDEPSSAADEEKQNA